MTEPSRNGSPVTFREFDDHRRISSETHVGMNRRHDRTEGRIDELERKWDRYAGPVSVVLVILMVVSTLSSIFAVWFGVLS